MMMTRNRYLSVPVDRWCRFLIPGSVILLFAMLAAQTDLSMSIPLVVGVSGVIVIFIAFSQYLAVNLGIRFSLPVIIGTAILLRLMFIWSPPVLSDDLYRYLLDGFMVLSGENPYSLPPASVNSLTGPMAGIAPLVNHAHLITIYPPMAQIVFAAGTLVGSVTGHPTGMKLVLSAMDIVSCLLILVLLRRRHLSDDRLILYAWNPLPILEIAGSGHIDGAATCFLLAAVVSATRSFRGGGGWFSGMLMAAAVFTKWVPLMAFPAWFLLVQPPKKLTALAGFFVSGMVLSTLFWPEVLSGLDTLATYLEHWEFSGFLFRSLRQMSGSGIGSRKILLAAFCLTIGGMTARQWMSPRKPGAALEALAAISGAYLVMAPTVYPWYALYLAVFVPFLSAKTGWVGTGLLFIWSQLLSYRILITRNVTGRWIEEDLTSFWILSAPAAAWAAHGIARVVSNRYRRFQDESFQASSESIDSEEKSISTEAPVKG